MTAWRLFAHSVLLVFRNLPAALRVSWVPYLIICLTPYAITYLAQVLFGRGLIDIATGSLLELIIRFCIIPIAALGTFWIAVSWHRFILNNEKPSHFPQWPINRLLAYSLMAFIIGCILFPFFAIAAYTALNTFGGATLAFIVGLPFAVIAISTIAFRLGSVLPGIAIGFPHRIFDGWKATAGKSTTVLLLVLISAIFSVAISLPVPFVMKDFWLADLIWSAVFDWVEIMLNVSILTTLYGHYIQKRELF